MARYRVHAVKCAEQRLSRTHESTTEETMQMWWSNQSNTAVAVATGHAWFQFWECSIFVYIISRCYFHLVKCFYLEYSPKTKFAIWEKDGWTISDHETHLHIGLKKIKFGKRQSFYGAQLRANTPHKDGYHPFHLVDWITDSHYTLYISFNIVWRVC